MVINWGTLNYWGIVSTLMMTMQENFELMGRCPHTGGD
jgi:putative heme iron utilization protein